MSYVPQSQLEGWTDWIKSVASAIQKSKPLKIYTEAVLPPAPPVSPGAYSAGMAAAPAIGMGTLAIAALAAALLLSRRRRR